MTDVDREKWDRKYSEKSVLAVGEPDEWLVECVKNEPPGRALDLACGLGQNSLYLDESGWNVDAVDISAVGLEIATEVSESLEYLVNWICADLDTWRPDREYEFISVFRFLDWQSVPEIVERGLKPGGLFCFETFARSQMDRDDNHLKNPAFTVDPADLERYFPFLLTMRLEEVRLPDRDVVRYLGKRKSET